MNLEYFYSRRALMGAIGGSVALAASPGLAKVQETPVRSWIITGTQNTRSSGPRNPSYVLSNLRVQALVLMALEGPVTRSDIEEWLASTDITLQNLIDTDVLSPADADRYVLAFNVMTRQDLQRLRQVANPAGASLAAAIAEGRPAFERALQRYDLPHVDRGVLTMALIGCVILDWDGLDVTAELGLRVPPVVKPNGDKFLMSMLERAADVSVRALYWGSHSATAADGAVVLTTFGDHEMPRRLAFPDISRRINADTLAGIASGPVAGRLAAALGGRSNVAADDAGRIMLRLRDGPALRAEIEQADTLELLELLRYVRTIDGVCHAHVPVFTAARDIGMLNEVRSVGRGILASWLETHYASVRSQLRELSAVHAGVPFERVFTQVWHDLFGWANYHLVRQGLMYDPYGPDAEWVSFVPFVWEASLDLYAGTRIF